MTREAIHTFAGGSTLVALTRALYFLTVSCALVAPAHGAPPTIANFWISANDIGPEAPIFYVPPDVTAELTVWARPANGYQLAAFALNLVAEQPEIVSFQEVHVFNPLVNGGPARRHQLTFDSTTGLLIDPDGVRGFSGFSFFSGGGLPAGVGIGPTCGGDPDCSNAAGLPAWRIATISYQANAYGSAELFLEIATQGIWQSPAMAVEPDPPRNTAAIFGHSGDVVHGWDANAGADLRNEHVGEPDAIVRVATADFNQNGFVEGGDFLIWQRGFMAGDSLAEGDADANGSVDGVDLAAWRQQLGLSFASAVNFTSIPEPQGFALAMALLWTAARCDLFRRKEPAP